MLYKTTCPISYKGSRVERGVELDISPKEAANYAGDLVLADDTNVEEEKVAEPKELQDMSNKELVARAKELGLKTTGSNSDLVERITLHLQEAEEV